MDAYGGSDEDSAELRKLLAEVVRSNQLQPVQPNLAPVPHR